MSESASVTVRVVNGSEALLVTLAENASVRTLKERLQELHPQRPSPAEQKLIFGGRVLDDAHLLADVFGGSLRVSDIVSVHLLLSGRHSAVPLGAPAPATAATAPAPAVREPAWPPVAAAFAPPAAHAASAAPAPVASSGAGLTRRIVTVPCVYINGVPYAIETQPVQTRPASPVVPPTAAFLGQARNGGAPPAAAVANRPAGRRRLDQLPMALLRAVGLIFILSQNASAARIALTCTLALLYVLYSIGMLRLPVRRPAPAAAAAVAAPISATPAAVAQRSLLGKLQSIFMGFFVTLLPVAENADAGLRAGAAQANGGVGDVADGAEGDPEAAAVA